jgi:hypothetical protein
VSIGHAIVCDSVYYGLKNTIHMYKNLLTKWYKTINLFNEILTYGKIILFLIYVFQKNISSIWCRILRIDKHIFGYFLFHEMF